MSRASAARVWEARTGTAPDPLLVTFSQSIEDDQALLEVDLAGSIAHALGLHHVGLLEAGEAKALVTGLQALHAQAQAGTFQLDPELEDVHMNVEHALQELVGPVAGKLHTGRSRNDQVALDIVLHTRLGLIACARATHSLARALSEKAQAHLETPWVASTHGQPAQPATLGFLLHGHALRLTDLTHRALTLFEELDESPLGAGACAGSTLPLDPAYTAELLGLAPPRNALLATGARDGTLQACQLAASVGLALSSLAQEWIELTQAGHVALDAEHTTGSSLMPHKRNPDSLELVRAHSRGLQGTADQVAHLLTGLPLGYHRDFQAAKAPLMHALATATAATELVARVVAASTVDEASLTATLEAPGITATDAVEALVLHGVPFRTAYTTVAQAAAASENGLSLPDALEKSDLPEEAKAAAISALTPDRLRRTTLAGPAPAVLAPALDQLVANLGTLANSVDQVEATAATPLELLSQHPETLVAQAGGGT